MYSIGEFASTLNCANREERGPWPLQTPSASRRAADESGDGSCSLVSAGFVIPDAVAEVAGSDVTTLPALDQAAVTVHRGEMERIGESWDTLVQWLHANGYELAGVCREVYWTTGDRPQSEWVTGLVQPVRKL